MMTVILLLLLFFSCSLYTPGTSDHVYSYKGNPYTDGPLNIEHIELSEILDSTPAHMTVYFPTLSGSYAPLVLVPGLFGLVYAEWYSTVLKHVSTHGYVVVGVDMEYPAATVELKSSKEMSSYKDKLLKVIDWLSANLNDNVLTVHGFPHVTADWSVLGLAGHSAGADVILKVAETNETVAKAIAFIEPFSDSFKKPLPYSLPALCYGTQFSEEYPKCIYPEFDYRHFYEMVQCPKILMNVTEYGHCDILNEADWKICRDLHFCKTVKDNDRVFYRMFIAGVMNAFFGNYLQENHNMLSFITNQTNIPIQLGQLKYQIIC